MWLSSVATGGIIWWLGWFLCPRILCGVLATMAYRETNPALCAFVWVWVMLGEYSEKKRWIIRDKD